MGIRGHLWCFLCSISHWSTLRSFDSLSLVWPSFLSWTHCVFEQDQEIILESWPKCYSKLIWLRLSFQTTIVFNWINWDPKPLQLTNSVIFDRLWPNNWLFPWNPELSNSWAQNLDPNLPSIFHVQPKIIRAQKAQFWHSFRGIYHSLENIIFCPQS